MTPRVPVRDAVVTDSTDSELTATVDSSIISNPCNVILQDAVRVLKLKLAELREAQAAGGEIMDEELCAQAADILGEWSAAVHTGIVVKGASASAQDTAGSSEAIKDVAPGMSLSPAPHAPDPFTPARRVWEIAELRHQIIAYLSQSTCATLLRTSRQAFDSAVSPLYKSHEFALSELVTACEDAEPYRRVSYVMKAGDFRDFTWLFGAYHQLENCTIYYGGLIAATLDWSRVAGSEPATVEIFRNLQPDIVDIPRMALLLLVRGGDRVAWTADVTWDDSGEGNWWIDGFAYQDAIHVGESLRRMEIVDAGPSTLTTLLLHFANFLYTDMDDPKPYEVRIVGLNPGCERWDVFETLVYIRPTPLGTLRIDAGSEFYDLPRLLDALSEDAWNFGPIQNLHLEMSVHVNGTPPFPIDSGSSYANHYDDNDENDDDEMDSKSFCIIITNILVVGDQVDMGPWLRALARAMVGIGGRRCSYVCEILDSHDPTEEQAMIAFKDEVAALLRG